jgi:hypothetical protein
MKLKHIAKAVVACVVFITLTGCVSVMERDPIGKGKMTTNNDFYENGALNVEKVKEAYFDMMDNFNYPIPDILKTDNFWVCDFNQSDVLALGMGGIFWINELGEYKKAGGGNYCGEFKDEQYGYLLHEIYLLPGQTLPEHRHIGGPDGLGPKMEAWQVRYGEVSFYGEYKHGDEVLISEWPEEDRPWGYGETWFKSKYIAKRDQKTNQMYVLKDPESWHGQVAGQDGAIVTEVATYHNHVEFSKPGLVFKNTGVE